MIKNPKVYKKDRGLREMHISLPEKMYQFLEEQRSKGIPKSKYLEYLICKDEDYKRWVEGKT